MSLLRSAIEALEEFQGENVPDYAILSHTWGNGEVTFDDMIGGLAAQKAGYDKLLRTMKRARDDGFKYVWIDTCCINKASSAELSEAINSMFAWYQNACICYAYLEDVSASDMDEAFSSSRWFTRGWTLQELLAPRSVEFYGKDFQHLGSRETLVSKISSATGIDKRTLLNRDRIWRNSVARRMSWASKRHTTRIEDMAYSLLGIFNVNLPLLYGEGAKAFTRLQEEIMKDMDDHSLFAWDARTHCDSIPKQYGVFAPSPKFFVHSGNILPIPSKDTMPYMMTNKGLQIQMRSCMTSLTKIKD
ncbi:heterokaryon incompatibility protein-domain-containing protein [Lineolata rhizophorae]|uniref:Heterokaryon incompatibility protein-domain-containing protein n=1 Tax=Lineolata rhizophorae TaxID=578093 RepID=A0A6A6PEG6_9PEZI|nr:heterokaryon incompatibility protein-domain-containing protein [Lineolata rhizophorae]